MLEKSLSRETKDYKIKSKFRQLPVSMQYMSGSDINKENATLLQRSLFLYEASWRLQKLQQSNYSAVDFLKFLSYINETIPLQDIDSNDGSENAEEYDN